MITKEHSNTQKPVSTDCNHEDLTIVKSQFSSEIQQNDGMEHQTVKVNDQNANMNNAWFFFF